jgi:dihydrolipoamide dehydrogenase
MATNIIVIGAGPAGEAAAKTAAKAGASVTLIERENAGGLCLNKGCIPSKTLLERIHLSSLSGKKADWAELQNAKTTVITGIRTQLEGSLKTLKINHLKGHARFTGPKSIDVNGTALSFDKAIIATGTEIYYPAPLDQMKNDLLNSDRLLELTSAPKSVMIVGGGAVGCEFACLLNAAGSEVTLVEMKEGLLPGEDPAIVRALTQSFETRGIRVKTGVVVKSASKYTGGWTIELSSGETYQVQALAACVGRFPDLSPLDPQKAGLTLEGRTLKLNERLQTSNPDIFAAGDVTLQTRLAHAASLQGEIAAKNALGASDIFDGSLVPRCLYSWPEVASVGKWVHDIPGAKTARGFFKGSAKALAAGEADGFVQIVSDPSGLVLGAQIIGPHATELIHIFSIALKAKMSLKELASVVFAHPTLSEVIRDAARR